MLLQSLALCTGQLVLNYIGCWNKLFPSYVSYQISLIYNFCLHRVGLDLAEGSVRDNRKAGVLEPAVSKIKSLKFATEAAITILRIDDMIKLDPERKDDPSYRQAYESGALD